MRLLDIWYRTLGHPQRALRVEKQSDGWRFWYHDKDLKRREVSQPITEELAQFLIETFQLVQWKRAETAAEFEELRIMIGPYPDLLEEQKYARADI